MRPELGDVEVLELCRVRLDVRYRGKGLRRNAWEADVNGFSPSVLHDPGVVPGRWRASEGLEIGAIARFVNLCLCENRPGRPHWARIGWGGLMGLE